MDVVYILVTKVPHHAVEVRLKSLEVDMIRRIKFLNHQFCWGVAVLEDLEGGSVNNALAVLSIGRTGDREWNEAR